MKKPLKITLISLLSLLLALLFVVLSYALYVLLDYSRIEDNLSLEVEGTPSSEQVKTQTSYTVLSQNVGFGAYTQDFTFFMDGGKESRAKSKESVLSCISSAKELFRSFDPDFLFIQEVDTDSTRSHHVDQRELITKDFQKYAIVFAVNYHSAYLFYPIFEPHGASNSGILTLSKANILSANRRSLPISTGFSKFLDLDRCYSVSRVSVENGKELVLFNVHLSAYGGSDEIRTAQMTMLFSELQAEYEKGNYCVCGGDFNHDFTGNSTQVLNGLEGTDFGWAQPFPAELLAAYPGIARATDYEGELVPTCRNCDIPYEKGNFTLVVDGFLVSDNVDVSLVKNVQTDFVYSDHNPVVMEFSLKD